MGFWLSATFFLCYLPSSALRCVYRIWAFPPLQCRHGGTQQTVWIPSMGPRCFWASWLILRSKTSFISTSQQQQLLTTRFIILMTSRLRNAFLNSITRPSRFADGCCATLVFFAGYFRKSLWRQRSPEAAWTSAAACTLQSLLSVGRAEMETRFTTGEQHEKCHSVMAAKSSCAKALFNLDLIILHHHKNVILPYNSGLRFVNFLAANKGRKLEGRRKGLQPALLLEIKGSHIHNWLLESSPDMRKGQLLLFLLVQYSESMYLKKNTAICSVPCDIISVQPIRGHWNHPATSSEITMVLSLKLPWFHPLPNTWKVQ